jgi:hypothetical protein
MALWKFSNLNKYGSWRHRIISWPDNKPFSHGPGFGKVIGARRFRYTHEHMYPPSLFVSPKDGQKYIMPGWQKVLSETTLKDIEWIKPEIKKTEQSTNLKPSISEYKFESKSEPGSFYVVKVTGDKVKCNCAGQYRAKDRQCKHMKEVKQRLKL